MILDIGKALQYPGVEHAFTLTLSALPDEDVLSFPEGITLEGTYLGAGETVFVRGTLKALTQGQCARCLGEAQSTVSTPFDEVYVRESRQIDSEDAMDSEQNVFSGHTLDLTEQARVTLLLDMPMRMFCHPDCLGLCPVCGANRNQAPCTCQKEMQQKHPFSALLPLLTKDEEV